MQINNEILIVDDDLSNLKLLDKILSKAGYIVRAVSDSQQVLGTITDRHPALILLDINMPGLDGFEICRRLKADPKTDKIPVIFISGFEDTKTKVNGFNVGGVDYLAKPYQPPEILARVKTHLHLRQLQSNLEQAYDEMEERVQQRTEELYATNQALQTSKRKIEQSLNEKNILLQEIYHRTKNNMQVITSLLTLQSGHIRDPETLQIFRETKNRIQSMALVHKKLYQSRDLSKIDLKYYISDLTDALLKSYQVSPEKMSLRIYAESVFLSIDTAVPCGLVINELFSNALLHAFPGNDRGEIRIDLHQTPDGEIHLCLADNGIGLPEEIDIRQVDSLGLQLVVSLIEEQLQGQLKVIRNNGTEFLITFSEPHGLNRLQMPQPSV
jgi:two-component sensor histidine kinase